MLNCFQLKDDNELHATFTLNFNEQEEIDKLKKKKKIVLIWGFSFCVKSCEKK